MLSPGERLFDCLNVHYTYHSRFPGLSDITVQIHAGERVALLGPNGSGKSTFLQLLDGLFFPDQGTLMFREQPLTEAALRDAVFSREFRQRVGFVFQNPDVQLFCPSVREDIAFGPLQLGVDEQTVTRRLDQITERFRLGPLLERSPHELSVGEKRKVAFATVFIMEPDVYLLDEPTAGLDPQTSTQLMDILATLARDGKTIITATHDLHSVDDIADRVCVFSRDRRIVADGPTAEILANVPLLRDNNLVHIHRHHALDHRGIKP